MINTNCSDGEWLCVWESVYFSGVIKIDTMHWWWPGSNSKLTFIWIMTWEETHSHFWFERASHVSFSALPFADCSRSELQRYFSVWEWKSFKQDIRMNDGRNRNNELLSNHVVELCCLFWLAGIYLDSCIDLNVMRESMCLNSQLHYKIHSHTYIHYMAAQPYFCTFVRFFESLLLVFMPLFFPISTNLVECHFLSS